MHRDQWTAELVIAELVATFKTGKGYGIAVYSPSQNAFEPVNDTLVAGLRLIEATAYCLGRESRDREMLLFYANAVAFRRLSELCAAHGFNRRTLYYARDRAAAAVADCLNQAYRDGHNGLAASILPLRAGGGTFAVNR